MTEAQRDSITDAMKKYSGMKVRVSTVIADPDARDFGQQLRAEEVPGLPPKLSSADGGALSALSRDRLQFLECSVDRLSKATMFIPATISAEIANLDNSSGMSRHKSGPRD